MKKIDKLIIKSFIGPFVLTTAVVVFIFLMRFLMLYFNELIGKDLGLDVFFRLFSYFSLITVPGSLPLAVLLASLMCFGNLGEHGELTAIKARGIPVTRVLLPAGVFAVVITIFSFFFNNIVNPWANLKGYSLLWDIKTTKLTLNIKEGIFYKELPSYRIKVVKKFPDNITLKGITIYDHSKQDGNTNVTVADSGKMYTLLNNNYLVFELYNGINYSDFKGNTGTNASNETQFVKNSFKKNKVIFSLDAFGMKRTDENQFKYHEYMKNVNQLNQQVDSLKKDIKFAADNQLKDAGFLYSYHQKTIPKTTIDTLQNKEPLAKIKADIAKIIPSKPSITNAIPVKETVVKPGNWIDERFKKINLDTRKGEIFESTISAARGIKAHFETSNEIFTNKKREIYRAEVEKYHKYSMAVACFVMFLIGSSLGSIIKKGGFGMPVLLSISFFILMYVLMQMGDKYAKEGLVLVPLGVWMPDFVLLLIGLYFLYKAKNDARLFDSDVYDVYIDKIKNYLRKKNILKTPQLVQEEMLETENV